MEIAKISGEGVSELPNPRTDWQQIWRGWLRRSWLHACQNSKRSPHWGCCGVCV